MPYIQLQTNRQIPDTEDFLKKLSALAAKALGKPEAYVMTALLPAVPMTFAGTDEPAAYLECKSIGLGGDKTKAVSAAICSFCEEELGVSQDRVYIKFEGAPGNMWGWKGGTF